MLRTRWSTDEEALGIFNKIKSNNLVSTNTGPAISGQLAKVTKPYWEEEYWKSEVASNIAESLLIPKNCEVVRMPKLNGEVT